VRTFNASTVCAVLAALCFFSMASSAKAVCPQLDSVADKEAVIAKMRRTASGMRVDVDTFDSCRIVDAAFATVSIERTPLPDGSHLSNFIGCSRGKGEWSCSIETPRRMIANVKVGSRNVAADLALGDTYSVETGRKFLQRAIDLAPTLTERNVCSYSKEKLPQIRKALAALKADFRFERATRDKPELVYGGDSPSSVSIGEQGVNFEPLEKGQELKFRCWHLSEHY
jgi:hypothetical protein